MKINFLPKDVVGLIYVLSFSNLMVLVLLLANLEKGEGNIGEEKGIYIKK